MHPGQQGGICFFLHPFFPLIANLHWHMLHTFHVLFRLILPTWPCDIGSIIVHILHTRETKAQRDLVSGIWIEVVRLPRPRYNHHLVIPSEIKRCDFPFFTVTSRKKYVLHPDPVHTYIKINKWEKVNEITFTCNTTWIFSVLFCFVKKMLVTTYWVDALELRRGLEGGKNSTHPLCAFSL